MNDTLFRAEGLVFAATAKMITMECVSCHCLYAMSEEHRDACHEHGYTFYCPNGHSQSWGETDLDRMKKQRDEARAQRDTARSNDSYHQRVYESEKSDHKRTKKQRDGYKGVVTRTKRRISNGVCPCCSRTFQNLVKHMATKHPEYVDGPVDEDEAVDEGSKTT